MQFCILFLDCTVTVSGPKPNKKCVFPFKLGRRIYRSCTDITDPGKFWCSTKTDIHGRHVTKEKEWGYCHPSCSKKKKLGLKGRPLRNRVQSRPTKRPVQVQSIPYDEMDYV